MKKLIFTLFIFHCSFIIANAQWVTQNSSTTQAVRDIRFINRYTGWACGDGIILKTTNAGTNWITQTHPATNKYLYSIKPINENVVYCVGWFETILKTTNGGNNWVAIRNGPFGSGNSYWTTYFINENTGWIAGSGQMVLKTTNGGDSIQTTYLSVSNIRDIYFKDSLNGVMCGEIGTIRKTTNGGNSWFQANIQLYGNMYNFYKITFVNGQFGWIVGNINPVYRTTDFGSNWDSVGYVTGSDEIYGVFFSSILTGWAGGTYGRMFKSTNGGFTWRRENTGSFTGYIESAYFYNDSIGWICGGGGRIQYTTSSGQVMKIVNNNELLATNFKLYQNFPNPFNPTTTIKFFVPENGKWEMRNGSVILKVYNVLGMEVATLVNEKLHSGTYEVKFNGSNLSSGIYIYKLTLGELTEVKKMILVK